MKLGEIKWGKALCPICGRKYEYIEGGYKPSTCGKFECVYQRNHPELYKAGLHNNKP